MVESKPYQQAKENRRNRRSGRTPESASEAAIALEEANSVRTLSDSELIEYAFLTSNAEPRTYKEAMSRDDAGLWHKASQEEYNALLEHGVWELCELPSGRKAVGCRVYRIKMNTVSEGVEAQTRRGGAKPIEIGGPEPSYIHVHYKEGN